MNGLMGCLMYVGYVVCIIVSGMLAWNVADPDSFWGFLWFLVLWGLIGSGISFVWNLICAVLVNVIDKDD